MSAAENALAFALKANGIGGFVRELEFDRREEACQACDFGWLPGARHGTQRKCARCRGAGVVTVGRKWRFDFAWPDELVACEVDGGGHVRGRHHRAAGYEADCEKLAAAALAGWLVLRVTPRHVKSGEAVDWIEEALALRAEQDRLKEAAALLVKQVILLADAFQFTEPSGVKAVTAALRGEEGE